VRIERRAITRETVARGAFTRIVIRVVLAPDISACSETKQPACSARAQSLHAHVLPERVRCLISVGRAALVFATLEAEDELSGWVS
jgi:hypothetical protein